MIEDFAETYARGETPIPCVRCNERVKFADLMDTARELGAEALATGHYVRRVEGANGAELHRAVDRSARPELFPVRDDARAARLSALSARRDGQARGARASPPNSASSSPTSRTARTSASCRTANTRTSCRRLKPDAATPGDIVDSAGNVLGRHDGVIHFTVGQRKGLGLSGNGEPLFVLKLDAAKAQVVVGPRDMLSYTHDSAARRQLARRRRDRDRLRREGAFDAPAGRRARHRADRDRTASVELLDRRRRRRARSGLRLLRARRHARAGRRLDRTSGSGTKAA